MGLLVRVLSAVGWEVREALVGAPDERDEAVTRHRREPDVAAERRDVRDAGVEGVERSRVCAYLRADDIVERLRRHERDEDCDVRWNSLRDGGSVMAGAKGAHEAVGLRDD
jgi:hypothetical protein